MCNNHLHTNTRLESWSFYSFVWSSIMLSIVQSIWTLPVSATVCRDPFSSVVVRLPLNIFSYISDIARDIFKKLCRASVEKMIYEMWHSWTPPPKSHRVWVKTVKSYASLTTNLLYHSKCSRKTKHMVIRNVKSMAPWPCIQVLGIGAGTGWGG